MCTILTIIFTRDRLWQIWLDFVWWIRIPWLFWVGEGVPLGEIFFPDLLYLFSNVGLFAFIAEGEGIGGHKGHRCCTVRFYIWELLSQFKFASLERSVFGLRAAIFWYYFAGARGDGSRLHKKEGYSLVGRVAAADKAGKERHVIVLII